jgi:D-serine deaminase-like pyridoxal phosphate-dependent protein
MHSEPWYRVESENQIASPALLIYPERIEHNIDQMLRLAGSADRLRPHIKTHKMAEIIRMQLERGIHKFKCATLAEAELLARCKARDVLLAYPLTGPGPGRLAALQKKYPETDFSCLVDHEDSLKNLIRAAAHEEVRLGVFMDLNVGMNRTGVQPGPRAITLYEEIASGKGIVCRGLHAYDGHLRNPDPEARSLECDQAFEKVSELAEQLQTAGYRVPAIIAGGSPTFPIHARRTGVELSPGTTLLWDARYGQQFPEMPFLPAASLLCRVISKPAPNTVCLDLGHKAVAAEMGFPRVFLPQLTEHTQSGQSEEHLVLTTDKAETLTIGTVLYAIPMHICPTVIKYPKALVIIGGAVVDTWKIAARDYFLPD